MTTLADILQGRQYPEPQPLGDGPRLANVIPREMRSEPLGQSNALHRLLQSFGRPSLEALERGYEGKATPKEIAQTFFETGPVGPFGMIRIPKPIRAYHGSPHDFDKFEMDKIGTGEGAQAFGHGLYFAEAEPVARTYRAGQYSLTDADAQARSYLLAAGEDRERAIRLVQSDQQRLSHDPDYVRQLERAREVLRSDRDLTPGRMYEVNLHARPEQFLDWDAPLSHQSQSVRSALASVDLPPEASGAGAYEALSERLANPHLREDDWSTVINTINDRVQRRDLAAQALTDSGIAGIRYLDQGSRAAGEGTRNYVVFNPEIIEILRKYGIAAPVAAPAIAAGLSDYLQSQPQQ